MVSEQSYAYHRVQNHQQYWSPQILLCYQSQTMKFILISVSLHYWTLSGYGRHRFDRGHQHKFYILESKEEDEKNSIVFDSKGDSNIYP